MVTITELVEKLNNLKYKYGDLEVKLYNPYWPAGSSFNYVELNPGDKAFEAHTLLTYTLKGELEIHPAPGPFVELSY